VNVDTNQTINIVVILFRQQVIEPFVFKVVVNLFIILLECILVKIKDIWELISGVDFLVLKGVEIEFKPL